MKRCESKLTVHTTLNNLVIAFGTQNNKKKYNDAQVTFVCHFVFYYKTKCFVVIKNALLYNK